MKSIIALLLISLAASGHAASYEVEKTCRIGTKDFQFKYIVDSAIPDSLATVIYDNAAYIGVAEGSDVTAEIGAIIAVFKFSSDTVSYSMLTERGLRLINTGTCK